MTRLVNSVEISVFAHATEDEDKVRRAVLNLIPDGADAIIEKKSLTGYYGDSITLLNVKLKNRRPSTETFENIVTKLSSHDQHTLISELESRVDKSRSLFLRLDKQKAYQGMPLLTSRDPIKVKFKFYLPHRADPVKLIKDYIEELVLIPEEEDA